MLKTVLNGLRGRRVLRSTRQKGRERGRRGVERPSRLKQAHTHRQAHKRKKATYALLYTGVDVTLGVLLDTLKGRDQQLLGERCLSHLKPHQGHQISGCFPSRKRHRCNCCWLGANYHIDAKQSEDSIVLERGEGGGGGRGWTGENSTSKAIGEAIKRLKMISL